ncbi:MAG TPA: tail fiber protein [Opitutus sp.]|nr:tail fiber protein [Opitutus sp.]
MSEPFIGEIVMFAGNFAPRNWALCNGQIMSIAQNQALFAILGTTYGGNGTSTFGLPDLRGRVPVHSGNSQGPGLQPVVLGEMGGVETVTLTQGNLPIHTHVATFTPTGGGGGSLQVNVNVPVASADASLPDPNGNVLAKLPAGRGAYTSLYAPASAATGSLGGVTATVSGSGGGITGGTVTNANAGGGLPVEILPPYLGVNFIIATQGIFPTRN